MNKYPVVVCCLASVLATASAFAFSETERQAVRLVVDVAASDLAKSSMSKTEGVLILPVHGDQDGFAEGLLKAALSGAGFNVVEPADQVVWKQILAEVEWTERKEDILDQATLLRFGNIQGARSVVYGSLLQVDQTTERVFAELALHAASLATRQHLWGGDFAQRYYLPGAVQGVTTLDQDVRSVLQTVMTKVEDSLKNSPKLTAGLTVVLVPLAGDQDGYITALVRDTLAGTQLAARDLNVRSAAQAQGLLRDDPAKAEAVLSGAVRELARASRQVSALQSNDEIRAAVQLTIQRPATGEIIWSGTFADQQTFTTESTIWEKLGSVDWKIWLYLIGGLMVLIVVIMLIKSASRVR